MPQTVVSDADAGAAKPQRAVSNKVTNRGDVTGNKLRQQKDEAALAAAQAAEEQDALIEAEDERKRNTVIEVDYHGADVALAAPERDDLGEVVEFIAKAGAEEMTYGIERNADGSFRHGRPRTFHFQEGQRYRVPRDLYEHMDSRGLVWH